MAKGIPSATHHAQGTLFTPQWIYGESSTQKHPLGTRLQVGERVFYYAQADGAIVAGALAESANLGGATTTLQEYCAVAVAAAIGDTKIYINAATTAQTADVFAEGFAGIVDASATYSGFCFKIKSNSAIATSGTTSYVEIYDELHIALTTSDKVTLVVNPYKDVKTTGAVASALGAVLGVAPIAITDNYYFWLQTWGPAFVFNHDGAMTRGYAVTRATTTAGTVIATSSAVANDVIGTLINAATDDYGALVYLRISF